MEHKYKYILLTMAIVAAVIFYFIGLRKIKEIPFKKRSFFLTSFMIAMALLGCSFDSSNAGSNKDAPGCNRDATGKDDPERIRELNKTSEWKEFKTFWKNLDAIEPGSKTDTNVYSYAPYIATKESDYEKRHVLTDYLKKKIDTLAIQLQPLVEMKLLDSLELKLLRETCLSRVTNIYYGNTSMMMRMIPPPGQVEKEKSIANLELRIDLLLGLKKKNKIDSSELKQALDNIQNEIKKFSILEIIGRKGFSYYPYDYGYGDFDKTKADSMSVLDRTIWEFEKSYEKFMKTYNAAKADENSKQIYDNYSRSKKELSDFSLVYPQYRDLIKDLTVND
jgi:hypothetical protein